MNISTRFRRAQDRMLAPALKGLPVDTVWSGGHDLGRLAVALMSFLLLQRVLTPAQYGAYFGLYALVGVLGALTVSGVVFATLQQLIGERDSADLVLRNFLSLTLIVGVLAASVAAVVALASIDLTAAEILFIVAAELISAAVISLVSVLVHANAGFPAAVRVRSAILALRLTVFVVLEFSDQLTIRNIGIGSFLTMSLYAAYLVSIRLPKHGYRPSLAVPSAESVRTSVMFAAPAGASKVQTDGDKYLLNAFGHGADAGVYGAAYRIVQLATLPLQAIEGASFHRFLPRESDGSLGQHLRRAKAIFAVMLIVSVVATAVLLLLLPVLSGLFEEQYREANDIIPWLALTIPLVGTNGVPLNGLLGLGRADARMRVYLAAAVITVVLYLVLVPGLSWRGALIATFAGELFLAAAGWGLLVYHQRSADRVVTSMSATKVRTPR